MKKTIITILAITLFGCGQDTNITQTENGSKSDTTAVTNSLPVSQVDFFKASTPAYRETPEATLTTKLDPYVLIINSDNSYVLNCDGKEISKNSLIKDMRIVREFAVVRNNKLFIYFEATDAEVGTSYLTRIDLKSNKIDWETHIWGFNIGEPLISKDNVYLTAFGTVGKVSLETGQPAWLYNDLYEKQKSNSFEKIVQSNDKIIFTDDNGKKIIVDDNSGKIQ